jgi:hypothetical protein
VDADAIVIDPQVPASIVRLLVQAPARRLVPFGAQLAAVVPPRRGAGERAWTPQGKKALIVVAAEAIFAFAAIAAWIACVAAPTPLAAEATGLSGIVMTVGFLSCFLATGPAMRTARESGWRQVPVTADPSCPARDERHAVTAYHRRYVEPGRDMDADARTLWTRAARAASGLERSDVLRLGLVDSVQVNTVLPHHLWDIAERLARLSALRAQQQAILRDVDATDPDIRAVLAPQRRAHELVSADIERRVRQLEVFADLTGKADAAKRRERAVRALTALNEPHRDLLIRANPGTGAEELAERMPADVQAIIDQADEAVRDASEAGRCLSPPTEAAG